MPLFRFQGVVVALGWAWRPKMPNFLRASELSTSIFVVEFAGSTAWKVEFRKTILPVITAMRGQERAEERSSQRKKRA